KPNVNDFFDLFCNNWSICSIFLYFHAYFWLFSEIENPETSKKLMFPGFRSARRCSWPLNRT
ncbi:MAG: hypothetical protein IKI77_06640, partial [Oscillospiraceae bacterium]|nr:hypothetical protein [Oscillospiraceae bacterium]